MKRLGLLGGFRSADLLLASVDSDDIGRMRTTGHGHAAEAAVHAALTC